MTAAPLTTTAGPRRALAVTLGGLLLVGAALFWFWPLGVVLGVGLGLLVVAGLGRQEQRASQAVAVEDLSVLAPALAPTGARPIAAAEASPARPSAAAVPAVAVAVAPRPSAAPEPVAAARPALQPAPVPAEDGVRADLVRLKADLGDDYPDFARAARLVVSTQYASAARLQRDLQLPYSRARRLLADLETEHFVGPATGTLPRQVLLPKERLPEVEQLFAGV